MTLRPAHLGELWIELVLVGSRLRGRVRTATEAARDLLLSRLDDLRAALKRLGIDIRDFQVEVDRKPAEEAGRRPRSHRRQILDFQA
jgi:flagellar hook-length control protein FliK